MKAKRGTKRNRLTIVAIALGVMGVVAILMLGVSAWFDHLITNWSGDLWDKESAENFLRNPLPADAHDIEFSGSRGRGIKLGVTFKASTESVDVFVSKFCEGKLYQGYDPFNAIDISKNTKEPPQGAYVITMEDVYRVIYYSYSPNTPDSLFGIRCVDILGFTSGKDKAPIQILVDKTSPDAALVKIEALFGCNSKCNIPQPTPTSVQPQKPE